MGKETFNYSNNEITVVWKPKACIHSSLCWKELGAVFNPRERPWIKVDGATTQQIVEQVNKCPSGALSYFRNDLAPNEAGVAINATTEDHLTKVQVIANGPYIINTECVVVHPDGKEEKRTGKLALCRCGGSGNKPYCDGSHNQNGFRG